MASTDWLSGCLTANISMSSARREILNEMFQFEMVLTEDEYQRNSEGYSAYFENCYETYCNNRTGAIAKISHRELLDIVKLLHNPNATRGEILGQIPQKVTGPQTDAHAESALALASRIWSISNVNDLPQCYSLGSRVDWKSGTLSDTLKSQFVPTSNYGGMSKIPKIFKARNLDRIAGIKIGWTGNFLDHLRLIDEDRTVLIFHHVTFLKLAKTQKANKRGDGGL